MHIYKPIRKHRGAEEVFRSFTSVKELITHYGSELCNQAKFSKSVNSERTELKWIKKATIPMIFSNDI